MTLMKSQQGRDESWTEAGVRHLARSLSGDAGAIQHATDAGRQRHAILERAVEDEVIPRLLRARRPQAMARETRVRETQACEMPARAAAAVRRPGESQVAALVELVLQGGQADAAAYVAAMQDGGTPVESLFLDLLTPAARRLGELWDDDTASFADVTMGMLRLGNVLRLVGRAFAGAFDPGLAAPSVLLVQMPGEQHGFGLAMVTQFFRHAGWNVREVPVVTSAGLADLVRAQWFCLVGISVARSDRLEALEADIRAIRKQSRNRAIGVMVGGPPFILHPQLAAMVGADATAADGRQAVRQARSLISLLAEQR